MANLSSSDYDRKMIEWLKYNSNVIKDAFYWCLRNSNFKSWLEKFHQMSPINDNRGPAHKPVSIDDISNFNQVLEVIYKIRCNFFHGTADLEAKRNKTLIDYSTRILEKLMWRVNEYV